LPVKRATAQHHLGLTVRVSRVRGTGGFTIVEVLVVIAIIAVLVGLIFPALGSAKRRAHKTSELNDLKNVGHAWMMYANSSADAALPGFLEVPVQKPRVQGVSRGWGVKYKYPDNSTIPLDSTNLTGPWTWRLLGYLSFEHRLIHSYLNETDPDPFTLVSEGKKVAYEPAFGYNALYVGGWWDMVDYDLPTPRFKFFDHCDLATMSHPLVIPTGVGQIRRPDQLVTFCAATNPGKVGDYRKFTAETPGFHAVMPPIVGTQDKWMPLKDDVTGGVSVADSGAWIPLIRHTRTIAVLCADGHVEEQGYAGLYDMRKWADSADVPMYRHAPCFSQPPEP